MWNYSFAIPSLLILGITLLNYFTLKRLPLKINKTFVGLLIVEAIVISADIGSSWACENYTILPTWVVILLNMIFFVFFAIRPYLFFVFTSTCFNLDPYENFLRTYLCRLPLAIVEAIIISSPITKAIFSIESTGYVRGPFYSVINYLVIVYIFFSFSEIIRFNNNLNQKRQLIGIVIYNSLLLIGIFFRMNYPKYLLMDTFCVMAILVINMTFMNPDFLLDRRTSLFNREGLLSLLSERDNLKYTKIIAFAIRNYQEIRDIYGATQVDKGLNLIGTYLEKTYPYYLKFYYRTGRFLIMTKPDVNHVNIISTIEERFKKPWISNDVELYLDVAFAKITGDYLQYSSDVVLNSLIDIFKASDTSEHNILVIDKPFLDQGANNIVIKRALEASIANNSVDVYLQPIVDSKNYKIVGAEALSRIKDENGNIISPSVFIPLAEKNGRIIELGEQVFLKTCEFIHNNDMEALGLNWININVSTIQFFKSDLSERLYEIVKHYDINPSFVHLELTEEAFIDESIMNNQIHFLDDKGFLFSLDDYGTGYSNNSRLSCFPFINIKLDMSIVKGYYNNPDAILPMMVQAFKKTGYSVTAEGIENENLAMTMSSIGCDYLQGVYFSQPLPMDEFINRSFI